MEFLLQSGTRNLSITLLISHSPRPVRHVIPLAFLCAEREMKSIAVNEKTPRVGDEKEVRHSLKTGYSPGRREERDDGIKESGKLQAYQETRNMGKDIRFCHRFQNSLDRTIGYHQLHRLKIQDNRDQDYAGKRKYHHQRGEGVMG